VNKGEQACAMETVQTWLARIEGYHMDDACNQYSFILKGEIIQKSNYCIWTARTKSIMTTFLGVCLKCGKMRQKTETLYELQVNLLDHLDQAVQQCFDAEQMQEGNFPLCNSCCANTPHTVQTFVVQPPKLLIVQIRRYILTKHNGQVHGRFKVWELFFVLIFVLNLLGRVLVWRLLFFMDYGVFKY
jgi:hypothetical protein